MDNYDVAVVGAGPAGMMAAIWSAREGSRTIVIDSNPNPCRKLGYTGGGRCNLSHEGSIEQFVRAYEPFGRFVKHSLYEFSPAAVRDFFAGAGLVTKVESDGKVFPITDRASDVSRVLADCARRSNVTFKLGKKVELIEKRRERFELSGFGETVCSKSLIISTGGMSWPHTGSTGDGYEFAKGFGHKIIRPKPALTGLITFGDSLKDLQGVSLKDVKIVTVVDDRKVETRGAVVFTKDGISGPAVYNLSREITDPLFHTEEPVQVYVDLLPGVSFVELEKQIIERCKQNPKREVAGLITPFVPRALSLNLCGQLAEDGKAILASNLSKHSRRELIRMLKYLPVTVVATQSLQEATITRGGVSITEIDQLSMQSKKVYGLFFAGEVIHADGPCGGYNLQLCWSTGALAGREAARQGCGGGRRVKEVKKTSATQNGRWSREAFLKGEI
jgi:hypothetical protein